LWQWRDNETGIWNDYANAHHILENALINKVPQVK